MPSVFISPSLQAYNEYYDGSGSEKYYMSLVADAMEPFLAASGIRYTRSDPDGTLSQAIRQSNEGTYDLHLALHSNASPEYLAGQLTGPDFYYYTRSDRGKRAATVLADNFTSIYPDPEKVNTMPTASLAEVTRTSAPSVLVEIAYHDNPGDAEWIKNNITAIARNLSQGLAEYFGVPFVDLPGYEEQAPVPTPPPMPEPEPETPGSDYTNATVVTESDALNIRRYPDFDAPVIGRIPRGSRLAVYCESGDWYIVDYGGVLGFAYGRYIVRDR